MSSLLAVIKFVRWVDTRGEGETRTRGEHSGLGGNWEADRRHGTGVEQVLFCTWRVTTPSKKFIFYIGPTTIMYIV
jgi:hypothetical protein